MRDSDPEKLAPSENACRLAAAKSQALHPPLPWGRTGGLLRTYIFLTGLVPERRLPIPASMGGDRVAFLGLAERAENFSYTPQGLFFFYTLSPSLKRT